MSSTPAPVIVADSGPLISLSRIRRLDLLRELYGEILVPPAVWHEVTVTNALAPGADIVRTADWIRVRRPNRNTVGFVPGGLGAGEREAFALTQEIAEAWLLIDDGAGRRAARALGLQIIGTVGILREAKTAGLIIQLRPILAELQQAGFFLNAALGEEVLRSVGE